jgi:hypothetical protein
MLPKESVTFARTDMLDVITGSGIAYPFGKSLRGHALALIDVVPPRFRAEPIEAARRLRCVGGDHRSHRQQAGHHDLALSDRALRQRRRCAPRDQAAREPAPPRRSGGPCPACSDAGALREISRSNPRSSVAAARDAIAAEQAV